MRRHPLFAITRSIPQREASFSFSLLRRQLLFHIREHVKVNLSPFQFTLLKVFCMYIHSQRLMKRLAVRRALFRQVTEADQVSGHLFLDPSFNRSHFFGTRFLKVKLAQLIQANELIDRPRVVIDAQVDITVVVAAISPSFLHNKQSGRLLPAAVAPRCLTSLKRL